METPAEGGAEKVPPTTPHEPLVPLAAAPARPGLAPRTLRLCQNHRVSEEKKSSNVLLIIAVVLGLIVLCCGGLGAGLVLWVQSNAEDLKAQGEELKHEADVFGATHTDRDCLEEAMERAAPCMDLDIKCNVRASLFGAFCLDEARPTPDFCDGVPPKSSILAFTKYSTQACAERGLMSHQGCSQVLQQVAQHCEGTGEAPRRR